jgi:hypothetical protein
VTHVSAPLVETPTAICVAAAFDVARRRPPGQHALWIVRDGQEVHVVYFPSSRATPRILLLLLLRFSPRYQHVRDPFSQSSSVNQTFAMLLLNWWHSAGMNVDFYRTMKIFGATSEQICGEHNYSSPRVGRRRRRKERRTEIKKWIMGSMIDYFMVHQMGGEGAV